MQSDSSQVCLDSSTRTYSVLQKRHFSCLPQLLPPDNHLNSYTAPVDPIAPAHLPLFLPVGHFWLAQIRKCRMTMFVHSLWWNKVIVLVRYAETFMCMASAQGLTFLMKKLRESLRQRSNCSHLPRTHPSLNLFFSAMHDNWSNHYWCGVFFAVQWSGGMTSQGEGALGLTVWQELWGVFSSRDRWHFGDIHDARQDPLMDDFGGAPRFSFILHIMRPRPQFFFELARAPM